MNLARILADAAAEHPERPASSSTARPSRTRSSTGAWRPRPPRSGSRGVRPGDRVALRLPNSTAFVAAYFGALRTRCGRCPAEHAARAAGDRGAPARSDARPSRSSRRTSIASASGLDGREASSAAERAIDPAVILFTSGTTGRRRAPSSPTAGSVPPLATPPTRWRSRPDDVVLGAAPFSHVLGQSTGLVATFLAGASVAVVQRFDAEETLATMTATRHDDPARRADDVHRALPGGARRSRAAAGPHRARRRRRRPRGGRPRLRAHVRRRPLRGLRPHGAERHRDDVPPGPAAQARLGGHAARRHRAPDRRAGRARRRRGDVPRPVGDPAATGRTTRRRARRSTPTAGSRPATSATSTTTATSSSSTARRS